MGGNKDRKKDGQNSGTESREYCFLRYYVHKSTGVDQLTVGQEITMSAGN
jgi:hypothetical protein